MICISIVHSQRNRTKPKDIAYGLYLYFLGLSYRNAAKALNRFVERMMFPFGNGFNTINHREYHIIEANFLTLSLMKRKLKLAITTFGFGLQSSQTVRPYLVTIYHQKETCLLQKDF